jgi:hypothetical protein
MPANDPSQTEHVWVKQQEVYGVTLTYDQSGTIIDKSAGILSKGAFSELWIRWDKTGEQERRITGVDANNHVKIDVAGPLRYHIHKPTFGKFKRTPGNDQGLVSELRIRYEKGAEGEQTIIDALPGNDADGYEVFVIAQSNPTCRYKLNQATGQWERVCTG